MDGFDHYGVGSAGRLAMLDGVYAEVFNSGVTTPSATNPRTETRSFNSGGTSSSQSNPLFRRVFGLSKSTIGIGYAIYLVNLPSANPSNTSGLVLLQLRNNGNTVQLTVGVTTTGQIEIRSGTASGTILYTTPSPVIVASAYQHFECRAFASATVGTVEIRINGVTVVNLTDVNTKPAAEEYAQMAVYNASNSTNLQIDDLFAWDDTGTTNNDFLGDRRVRTIYPDADTVIADWTPTGAATGYQCINQTAPDDETTYIAAAPLTGDPLVPLHSIFGLEDVMSGIGAIAAVQTYVRMRKIEAGDTNVQVSMVSSGDESNGADRPITEIYTYWMDVHETNPNTGTPWSESSLNAAQLKLTRTL